jgi:hypothetical protein
LRLKKIVKQLKLVVCIENALTKPYLWKKTISPLHIKYLRNWSHSRKKYKVREITHKRRSKEEKYAKAHHVMILHIVSRWKDIFQKKICPENYFGANLLLISCHDDNLQSSVPWCLSSWTRKSKPVRNL